MKNFLRSLPVALIFLLFAASAARAQTCDAVVTVAGGGAGLSAAISAATAGDVLCVEAGTYSPGNTREATFSVNKAITIAGGFAVGSNPASVSARAAGFHSTSPTILDGDWDNSHTNPLGDVTANYKVVTITAAGAVLDGVIVQGGNDDREPSAVNSQGVGGGVTIDGGSNSGISATVQNSILRQNQSSANGAAVSCYSAGCTLINVLLTENGEDPAGDPINIVAAAGGRTGLLSADSDYAISIINSTITYNGGPAFFDAQASSSVTLTMENSIMFNNALDLPENSATFQEPEATLTNVIFEQADTFCGVGGVAGGCTNVTATDPNLDNSGGLAELQLGSNAIDYGDNSLVPSGVTKDGNGGERFVGASVDAGWLEFVDTNPDIAFDPASPLDLGTILDNVAAVPFSFDIQNEGVGDLTLTSISQSGTAGFTVLTQPTLPATIAQGSAATVSGEYQPTVGSTGSFTLTFEFGSNDPNEVLVSYDVTVTVSSAEPNIVAPASADFGVTQPNVPVQQNITIGNDGDAPLNISAANVTGTGFSLVSAPTSIPAGGNDDVVVEFVQAADGNYAGNLEIVSDDPDDSPTNVALTAIVATNPALTAEVVPFRASIGDKADPTIDSGDFFYVDVVVGSAGNPVDDLMGVSTQINWDPAQVAAVNINDYDLRDNSPGINQDAEDQADAGDPVVGSWEIAGITRGAYVAVGDWLSDDGATAVTYFEEASNVAEGRLNFSVSRVAPAVGKDGTGNVARLTFQARESLSELDVDGDGVVSMGDLSGAFSYEASETRWSQVTTAGGTATFQEFVLPPTGVYTITDRIEVYPGDLNDDGEVSVAQSGASSDVFVVGQCFEAPANQRADANGIDDLLDIEWEAKDAVPSAHDAAYTGFCDVQTAAPEFADSDGDGEVDQAELLAIAANETDAQSDFPSTKVDGSEDGEPAVVDAKTSAQPIASYVIEPHDFEGGKIALEIALGSEDQPVDNLYGFAAALQLPKGMFRAASGGGSMLADGNLLKADLYRDESGIYEVAVTRRYPATTASGWGPVLRVELALTGDAPRSAVKVDLRAAQVSLLGEETVHLSGDGQFPVAMGKAGTSVATEEESEVPATFDLEANYPNPFNPATTIKYQLAEASAVRLAVYDMLGREVSVLVDTNKQAAGKYDVQFDARGLASGTYIYRLETDSYSETLTMHLLK